MDRVISTAVGVMGLAVTGYGFWLSYESLVSMRRPISAFDTLMFLAICGGITSVGLVLLMLGIIGEAVIGARRAAEKNAVTLQEMWAALQRNAPPGG